MMNYEDQGITREERELLDQLFESARKNLQIQPEFDFQMHGYYKKPASPVEGLKSVAWM
jgi:hypothetical protein